LLLALTLMVVVAVPGLLCPARAGATEMLDQSQTAPSTGVFLVGGGMQMSQIVTANIYGTLHRVSLYLDNLYDTDPVTVSIQTVIGGEPSGNEIGHGEIPASAFPPYDQPGWVDAIINGGVLIAPGTQYAIVVFSAGAIQWYYSGDVYSRGYMLVNSGGGWSSLSTADAMFQTYVIPDVLDQAAYVGDIWGEPHGLKMMAQTFTAGLSGVLDRVNVGLNIVAYQSYPRSYIDASIQTVNGGYPSGVVIGQGSFPTDLIPFAPPTWITIPISGAVVTAGTQYALVLNDPTGEFVWLNGGYGGVDPYPGGHMLFSNGYGWTVEPVDADFETYVATPLAFAPPPPPATITPCSSGVCPAVIASVTPKDSTARVTSTVQFQERPDGTVHGILNFNDSRTGDLALKGCVTDSTACLLTVTTFDCADEHAITVAGTYTPRGETAADYLLTLSGVRDGIGTFTLTVGDYTYTLTRHGIVDVTCP
jgi:hypothetical protein